MRYIACLNPRCDNHNAPYHFLDGDEWKGILCPLCGREMEEIEDPTTRRMETPGDSLPAIQGLASAVLPPPDLPIEETADEVSD